MRSPSSSGLRSPSARSPMQPPRAASTGVGGASFLGRVLMLTASATLLLILIALTLPWKSFTVAGQTTNFFIVGLTTVTYGRLAELGTWNFSLVGGGNGSAPSQFTTSLIAGLLIIVVALALAIASVACASRSFRLLRGERLRCCATCCDCACGPPAIDAAQKHARSRCSSRAAVVLLVLTAVAAAAAAAAVGIGAAPFVDLVEAADPSASVSAAGIGIAAFTTIIALAAAGVGVAFLRAVSIGDFADRLHTSRSANAGTIISLNQAHGIPMARL